MQSFRFRLGVDIGGDLSRRLERYEGAISDKNSLLEKVEKSLQTLVKKKEKVDPELNQCIHRLHIPPTEITTQLEFVQKLRKEKGFEWLLAKLKSFSKGFS